MFGLVTRIRILQTSKMLALVLTTPLTISDMKKDIVPVPRLFAAYEVK